MKRKRLWIIIALVLLSLIVAAAVYIYPYYRFMFEEKSIVIDQNLTIYRGGGGNTGILVTDEAVVVIDTKMGSDAEKIHKTATQLAGSKKIIVINTHYHGDHVKGNSLYKGSDIYIGGYDKKFLEEDLDAEDMPNRFVADSLVIQSGTERIAMYNLGQAHTPADMIVYLESRNVLFTGDLVFRRVIPFVMEASRADVDKWIATLDYITGKYPAATFVPGHGDPGDKSMAEELRQYFTDMKAAAADPSKEKELVAKYKEWTSVPMAATPEITIEYIKKSKP